MENTGFTQRELEILDKIKIVMPKPFIDVEQDKVLLDKKLLAYAQLVIDDINYYPPMTGFTIFNFPRFLDTILVLGVQTYTNLFMQMKWTMNDFSYTDNGLSLNIDRVNKLGTSFENFYKIYMEKVKMYKHNIPLNTIVLASPRYQNILGQFIRATFGWSF